MKTKAWFPAHAPEVISGPVPLSVEAPCLMWGGGVGPIGPVPLLLCMFKACDLGSTATNFSIQAEDGEVLLELVDGILKGKEVMVDLFERQASMFVAMRDELLGEANSR